MHRRLIGVVVCALLVATRAGAADPKWTRVDTPNFILIGAQGEAPLREVGREFEGFREALNRLLSTAITSTAVPTVVVVFPDDKTFQPYKPVYDGKPVSVGGLFVPRLNVNYILLGPNRGDDNLRPVFHEYSHLVINNVAPAIPLWLNEGLAEYYSAFDLDRAGRSVIFGRLIQSHFKELSSNGWMPLPALMSTTRSSPVYNENARRGAFYAESWMLVHMILHGEPDRRKQFASYLAEMSSGVPSDTAWQHQFGGEDMLKALQQYSSRQTLTAREYKLSDRILKTPGTPVPLSAADADATLGEVLLGMRRREAAMLRFDRALAVEPASVRATIGKASASGKVPQLPSTPAASGDWFAEYTIGAMLIEQADALERASVEAARATLERAAAAKPDMPNVQVLFALAADRLQPGSLAVTEALRKAHEAAPARDDYTVMLARALARAGNFGGARLMLGSVMAHPSMPEARAIAVSAMDEIVAAETASKAEAAPRDPVVEPDPPPSPPAIEVTYRSVGPDEQRVEGTLERIDCVAKRVDFVVRLPDRVAHFRAATLGDVDFISYRADLAGKVGCGARKPPDRVYVTFRPGTPDGVPVAIEFLPLQ